MMFRNLDSNSDWQWGQGLQSYVGGQQAIALNVKTRLLSFLGNAFWDVLAGINWFVYFGTPGQSAQILLSTQAVILQSYGITKVANVFLSTVNGVTANLQFNAYTIYSQTQPYSQNLQVALPGQGT